MRLLEKANMVTAIDWIIQCFVHSKLRPAFWQKLTF